MVERELEKIRPLAGRESEVKLILEQLQKALSGRGGKLAVAAESGVGKTRLAQEVAARAKPMGARALMISCRGSLYRPHLPLIDLIRGLLDIDAALPRKEQSEHLIQALADLGLTDIVTTFIGLMNLPLPTDTGPVSPTDSDDNPADLLGVSTLCEAFDKLLGRLTEKQSGLCLIFDDLDEAAALAQAVILRLLIQPEVIPVLVMATFTPGASRELRDVFSGKTIDLSNLRRKETLILGAKLLNAKSLSLGLADEVWTSTKGHPLFISTLIERLQADERITQPETGGEAALILGEKEAFTTLASLLLSNADRLTKSQREMLVCASVLGNGFRAGALAVLLERDQADIPLEDVATLVLHGWLEQTGSNRKPIYRFTHRVKREAIYESLSAERRQHLHLKAGDYYAAPRMGWRLRTDYAVYHYLKAGYPKNALPVIEVALNQALSTGDRDRVFGLYQLGIEVTSRDPDLAVKQAEWAEGLGDAHAAAESYVKAAETYSQLGPTVAPLTLLGKLGLVLLAVDPQRATNILERALTTLMLTEQEDLRWRVEAGLVWGMALTGRSYEAIRHCRDALGKLGDTVGFGSARTLMRGVLGMVLFYDGDQEEAYPHLESARAGWGARGDQEGVVLLNQVMIGMPKTDITQAWLRLLLLPLLKA
ncbi:MAG: AAA family ATPase [Anaerolineae bacterium]|nr:AAA family ATPase [Anaerolineae bacterium]